MQQQQQAKPQAAWRVPDWIEGFGKVLSRSKLYAMLAKGEGPKCVQIDGKKAIVESPDDYAKRLLSGGQ